MPGTIQVSVLDFKGMSSSTPSSMSIKVSMGKREYQTWDKGDFSFPLTTLRNNLIVTLQDAEGNEISHTEVKTISIVEKGFWDDLFPLHGGGHVHMKLKFVLNEEERNRIRFMRESALKKKTDVPSANNNEVAQIQDGAEKVDSLLNPDTFTPQNHKLPNATDRIEERCEELADEQIETQFPHNNVPKSLISKPGKRSSLEKIPTSVKKMISAFESSVPQGTKPQAKPAGVKSQSNLAALEGCVQDHDTKSAESSSGRLKSSVLLVEKQEIETKIKPKEEHIGSDKEPNSIVNFKATLEEMNMNKPRKPSAELTSIESEIRTKTSHEMNVEEASSSEMVKELVSYCGEENFGPWLFADDRRSLCITTGSKKLIDMLGNHHVEAKSNQQKKKQGNPWPDSSSDNASSPGPFAQAIKIVVVVSFGILVLFTRQREPPRKNSAKAGYPFLSVPDYMDLDCNNGETV